MGWFHAWFFKTVTPNMGWFHAWVWVCTEVTTSKAICPIPVKQDINDNMGYTMFKYTWKCQGKNYNIWICLNATIDSIIGIIDTSEKY